ncbi:MAG: fumarylacetoacetate hydrolase family protein [Betaproteobacteria bacterium]|nr:MAG: fumarylacetoacetate hydrolase family protein [Betaproteobacteria bacterium]
MNSVQSYVFEPAPLPAIPVAGQRERLPVHRIYCVGRNYAAHAREMGKDPDREPPFFFMKPADAIVPGGGRVKYPPGTVDLHHEIELVVALHRGGSDIALGDALEHVFGYAVGLDLTRRDLQSQAKKLGRPWDFGKSFDQSAPVTEIYPAATHGHHAEGKIMLAVNGEVRQQGDLSEMIWSVPETIAYLSQYYELVPGDLIFTGTPAGVGAVAPGDKLVGRIEDLAELSVDIVA